MTEEQQKLFDDHKNLVYSTYSKYFKKYYKYRDDLIQVGMIELWKSSIRYNPEKYDIKFAHYVYLSIRYAMYNFLKVYGGLRHELVELDEINTVQRGQYSNRPDSKDFYGVYTNAEDQLMMDFYLTNVNHKDYWLLYMNGWTSSEIAKRFNTTPQLVHYYLNKEKKIIIKNLTDAGFVIDTTVKKRKLKGYLTKRGLKCVETN